MCAMRRSIRCRKAPSANAQAPSTDKVIQLANAGNPVALTILGLRALDGTNGAPVNLPDAVKFLEPGGREGPGRGAVPAGHAV